MGDAGPLETWAVATFAVATVGIVAVLAGHVTGSLGNALRGIGTLQGVLVFGYLWTLVVVSTRWALAGGGLDRIRADGVRSLAVRGTVAGAFVGAGFVLGVVAVAGLGTLLAGGIEPLSLSLVGLIGGTVGAAVGAAVGAVLVFVDVGLHRTVAALTSRPGE